ncbi:N-alpha-acetyltransferase 15, NatA auxiliary subunit-like [Lingula anatina]|uniref:N-alpha-acetyltransferase 15, NatA auxiliary subunit-like n=1 Tax=Lingula anatina TaxID=7574 RepID=A0A2R2MN76_LINAN|nr:N-alpha-acetyltransferase 15, NatA auxiliary subunit-like [Lingula anatina]|eukprot:XP_023931654.1 N-alpha-acetyltransferase 15, NatA auxiliary subunit-like [Lingula anatina]
MKAGKMEAAAKIYRELIDRNPENCAYYSGYEEASNPASPEERLKLYQDVLTKLPRASAPKKLPLGFLTGEAFRKRADVFLRNGLHKGVPPLFTSLRPVYKDPEKVKIIEELVLGYEQSLQETEYFSPEDVGNAEQESASVLLWTHYFLAQHYDFLNQTEKALAYINKPIESTPTLVELYVLKGKIYKHAGDIHSAVENLDEAQALDTADRFVNSKCAKYMLRANMVKEGEEMCSKFTRVSEIPIRISR